MLTENDEHTSGWKEESVKEREKGACYTIFTELAVKDTPGFENFLITGFAEFFFNFVPRGTKLYSFRWYPPRIHNVSWLTWWSVFLEDFLWNEKTFLSRGNFSVLIMVNSFWFFWWLSGPCTSNHTRVHTWGDDGQFDACGPHECHSIAMFYRLLSHVAIFLAWTVFFLYLFTK